MKDGQCEGWHGIRGHSVSHDATGTEPRRTLSVGGKEELVIPFPFPRLAARSRSLSFECISLWRVFSRSHGASVMMQHERAPVRGDCTPLGLGL